MGPLDKLPEWEAESAIERAESCVVFLAVHGFLSDAEKARVRKRLVAWAAHASDSIGKDEE